jgi:hypothetical protein
MGLETNAAGFQREDSVWPAPRILYERDLPAGAQPLAEFRKSSRINRRCGLSQTSLQARSLLKNPKKRLLTRAAQNRDLVFPSSY